MNNRVGDLRLRISFEFTQTLKHRRKKTVFRVSDDRNGLKRSDALIIVRKVTRKIGYRYMAVIDPAHEGMVGNMIEHPNSIVDRL